jgi:hypothetical protein
MRWIASIIFTRLQLATFSVASPRLLLIDAHARLPSEKFTEVIDDIRHECFVQMHEVGMPDFDAGDAGAMVEHPDQIPSTFASQLWQISIEQRCSPNRHRYAPKVGKAGFR